MHLVMVVADGEKNAVLRPATRRSCPATNHLAPHLHVAVGEHCMASKIGSTVPQVPAFFLRCHVSVYGTLDTVVLCHFFHRRAPDLTALRTSECVTCSVCCRRSIRLKHAVRNVIVGTYVRTGTQCEEHLHSLFLHKTMMYLLFVTAKARAETSCGCRKIRPN